MSVLIPQMLHSVPIEGHDFARTTVRMRSIPTNFVQFLWFVNTRQLYVQNIHFSAWWRSSWTMGFYFWRPSIRARKIWQSDWWHEGSIWNESGGGLADCLSACLIVKQIYGPAPRAAPPLQIVFSVGGEPPCWPSDLLWVASLTPALVPNGFWSLFSTDDPWVTDGVSSECSAGRNERNLPFGRSGGQISAWRAHVWTCLPERTRQNIP